MLILTVLWLKWIKSLPPCLLKRGSTLCKVKWIPTRTVSLNELNWPMLSLWTHFYTALVSRQKKVVQHLTAINYDMIDKESGRGCENDKHETNSCISVIGWISQTTWLTFYGRVYSMQSMRGDRYEYDS